MLASWPEKTDGLLPMIQNLEQMLEYFLPRYSFGSFCLFNSWESLKHDVPLIYISQLQLQRVLTSDCGPLRYNTVVILVLLQRIWVSPPLPLDCKHWEGPSWSLFNTEALFYTLFLCGHITPHDLFVPQAWDTGALGGLDMHQPHSDKPQELMSRGCCGLSLW